MDNIKPSNSQSSTGSGSGGSSKTLDLRPDNHEEIRAQKEEERQKLLQQQAANSNIMTATGIDGMKSKGFNNVPGASTDVGTPGLFTLPQDQLDHPQDPAGGQLEVADKEEDQPAPRPKKGLFSIFSKN